MQTGGSILTQLIGPGQSLQSSVAGTQFYVVACPGAILLNAGQGWSQFYQGTGAQTGQPFTLLQIRNPGNTQIVVQIWVGFNDFIDHRQIPLSPAQIGVPKSTTFLLPAGWNWQTWYEVPDISEQFFNSAADGLNYFAVNRSLIQICNRSMDSGFDGCPILIGTGPDNAHVTPLAVLPSSANAQGGTPLADLPLSPYQLANISGNFWIKAFTNSMDAFVVYVSEIYQGIPALGATP